MNKKAGKLKIFNNIAALVLLSMLISACGGDSDTELDRFYENRQLWESLNESEYEIDFIFAALNSTGSGNFRVYVESETVKTAFRTSSDNFNDSGFESPDSFIFRIATVSQMFVFAEGVISSGGFFQVEYHPQLGYPTSVTKGEVSHGISDLRRGSETVCPPVILPSISANIVLDSDLNIDACDANVQVQQGDFVLQLDRCFNNTFTGLDETPGTFSLIATYPGYTTQVLDDINVYQFICGVETVELVIELERTVD